MMGEGGNGLKHDHNVQCDGVSDCSIGFNSKIFVFLSPAVVRSPTDADLCESKMDTWILLELRKQAGFVIHDSSVNDGSSVVSSSVFSWHFSLTSHAKSIYLVDVNPTERTDGFPISQAPEEREMKRIPRLQLLCREAVISLAASMGISGDGLDSLTSGNNGIIDYVKSTIIAEQRLLFRQAEEMPTVAASGKSEERKESPAQIPQEKEATKEKNRVFEELQKLKDAIPQITEMHFRKDGLLDGFEVRGYRIDCSSWPLHGHQIKEALSGIERVITNIEGKKHLWHDGRISTLTVRRNGGFEFDVESSGEKKHWLATAHDVLLLVEPTKDISTGEERKQLPDLRKQIYELEIRTGQWRGKLTESEKERSRAEQKKLRKGEGTRLMEETGRLEREMEMIEMKTHIRVLKDEDTGSLIREFARSPNAWEFFLERDLEGGIRRDHYSWGGLEKREFLRGNERQESEEFRKDTLIARHTYERGTLKQTEHIQLQDGTERISHITDHELSGKVVRYPLHVANTHIFLAPFGKDTLSNEASRMLVDSLQTKDQYDFFEELYWEELSPKYGKNDAFREAIFKRGRELYGVDQQITQLEQFLEKQGCPFKISLDPVPSGSRVKMREAVRVLPDLLRAVGTYPPQYLKNGSLRSLHILGNLSGLKVEGTRGFYDSDDGLIVVDPSPFDNRDHGPEQIFHHEFLHFDDDAAGGLFNHQDWIHRFHGNEMLSNGKEVYGKLTETFGSFTMEIDDTGFARAYGRLNPNEDLATIGESLMTPWSFPRFQKRRETDPVLHAKIDAMKRRYFVRSLGRMDEHFWKDIENKVPITPDYWNEREQRGDFKTEEIRALEQYNSAHTQEKDRLTYHWIVGNYFGKDDATKEQALKKLHDMALIAIERDPYDLHAWICYSQSCIFQKDETKRATMRPEQIALFEKRLQVLPIADHEPSFYSELARLYAAEGQTKKAADCYERAIKLFPFDFSLREDLLSLQVKEHKDKPPSQEIVAQREALYRQSGQKEHFAALRDTYLQAGKEQEATSLTKTYIAEHFSDAAARATFEQSMVKQKREQEVVAFYEEIDKRNPSVDVKLALAKFAAYNISGNEGDKRFSSLIQEHRDPSVLKVYFTFLRDWIRAKGVEKGRAYFLQKQNELHGLVDSTGDLQLATGFLSLAKDHGTIEEQRHELTFVRNRINKDFLRQLNELHTGGNEMSETRKMTDFVEEYRWKVIRELNRLEKTHGSSENYLRVNQEYLDMLATAADFHEVEDASAFYALLLHLEKTDIVKAEEFCKKYWEDNTWGQHKQSLGYELCFLRAMKEPMRWVRVEGLEGEYAWAREENTFFHRSVDGTSTTKLKRWVAKADFFDQFEWGGPDREEAVADANLPAELRKKE